MIALDEKIKTAERKRDDWMRIVQDPELLIEKGKTRGEAFAMLQYCEGVVDGLVEARRLINRDEKIG